MNKQIESIAKTVEQAIELGLAQLGKSRADVNIKIIEQGGLFKKAKVLLTVENDAEAINNEKNIEEITNVDNIKKAENSKNNIDDRKIADVKKEKKAESENNIVDTVADNAGKVENFESNINNKKFKHNEIDPLTKKEVSADDKAIVESKIVEFFDVLCNNFDINKKIEFDWQGGILVVAINGDNVGKLIGYRGETMSSMQIIINTIVRNTVRGVKVRLDIENYKEKREEVLKNLCNRCIEKVRKTGKNVPLEHMNSYERRIIHSIVADITDIVTKSEGEGKNRHIVFIKKV